MSPSDIRRLSLLALTLLRLPSAVLSIFACFATALLISQAGGGQWFPNIDTFVAPAFPPAVAALTIWGSVRRPDSFGRVFAPPGVTGAAVLGCAAIRVY